jgi:polar amino acid transport system ATP-binding protein
LPSEAVLLYPTYLVLASAGVRWMMSAVFRPKYLIADEVAASLDPVLAGEVIEIIRELVSDGIGVLVVTHQIEFIRQHADFVYFLMRGTIVEKGAPAEILAHPVTPELGDFLQGVRRGR